MIKLDKHFIRECKKGDRSAQKQLFGQLYGPMYRVCFRYLGRQAEAEDCLMRGMMRAFKNIEDFEYRDDESIFKWVQKIMINEALMELRNKHNLQMVPVESALSLVHEEEVLSSLAAETLYTLIADLPTGYRTVFNLFVIEGYTHAEIAEMLNITESTSRTQLAKARNRLQVSVRKMNIRYA